MKNSKTALFTNSSGCALSKAQFKSYARYCLILNIILLYFITVSDLIGEEWSAFSRIQICIIHFFLRFDTSIITIEASPYTLHLYFHIECFYGNQFNFLASSSFLRSCPSIVTLFQFNCKVKSYKN